MKKRKIVVANWKMNIFSEKDAKKLISDVKKKTLKVKNTDVVFCPPFVYLSSLSKTPAKNYFLGSQNISDKEKGSFTGEVSALHIKQYKTSYSIIGHSERRKMGEADEVINQKVLLALSNNIKPILCIGEDKRDDHGGHLELIKTQIENGLKGVSKSNILDVLIAYEPVFAIGAKDPLNPVDIHEMSLWIKKCLKGLFGSFSENVRILYGGAVNFSNSKEIINTANVDGFLVGRDSLDANNFSEIIKSLV